MLKLNEKFKVSGEDEYNYTLMELSVIQPKGQDARMAWKTAGYFGKLSHAISSAINKHIKNLITDEELTCKELLERLTDIEKEVKKIDVSYKTKIKKGENK